jgi:hypothetical protein
MNVSALQFLVAKLNLHCHVTESILVSIIATIESDYFNF